MPRAATERAARFRALFEANSRAILAFALRRVERPEDAADVLSETMLVAWRRLDELPPGDEARMWLFGVARNVLSNQQRSNLRGARLGERLRTTLTELSVRDPADAVGERAAVRDALARLDAGDREILLLAGWEGLSPREIAVVLSLPDATARTRLHRARARLRQELTRELPAGERTASAGHEEMDGQQPAADLEGEA